jgi:DNA gyrase subunit B
MLSSQEIKLLITAMGMGIGSEEKDIEKLRYHRLIIMTDADVDGSHIRTLILTFFYRQYPELIENGHILIAQPPLFKVRKGKKEIYLKDEAALEDHLIQIGSDQTEVVGTGSSVALQGEALANVIRRHSHLERMIEVIERSRRSRDVVVAASRDDRLDAEAFGEPDRLREIAASLQSELESMENVDEISIQVIEKTPGEMPVILVENINEQKNENQDRVVSRFLHLARIYRSPPTGTRIGGCGYRSFRHRQR